MRGNSPGESRRGPPASPGPRVDRKDRADRTRLNPAFPLPRSPPPQGGGRLGWARGAGGGAGGGAAGGGGPPPRAGGAPPSRAMVPDGRGYSTNRTICNL